MDISVESLETPALTKAQLAELLFEQIGLNKRESKDMIEAFFDRTGETIPIQARRVVTFHASQKLKEQIQDEGRESRPS